MRVLVTGEQPIFCEGLSSIANRLYPAGSVRVVCPPRACVTGPTRVLRT